MRTLTFDEIDFVAGGDQTLAGDIQDGIDVAGPFGGMIGGVAGGPVGAVLLGCGGVLVGAIGGAGVYVCQRYL